jgi:hypothetical protein
LKLENPIEINNKKENIKLIFGGTIKEKPFFNNLENLNNGLLNISNQLSDFKSKDLNKEFINNINELKRKTLNISKLLIVKFSEQTNCELSNKN